MGEEKTDSILIYQLGTLTVLLTDPARAHAVESLVSSYPDALNFLT